MTAVRGRINKGIVINAVPYFMNFARVASLISDYYVEEGIQRYVSNIKREPLQHIHFPSFGPLDVLMFWRLKCIVA